MSLHFPIYLDNNATTAVDPRVLEEMLPYFTDKYGNAATRTHRFGWQAKDAVEYARERIATLIGSEPGEIVFTSGATESNNLALKGVYEAYATKGNHIVTITTEHKAVLDPCHHLEKKGAKITYLPVQPDGIIDMMALEKSITPQTILIAVMYANNETGVIQPIREISSIARKHGILFFSDATQAIGKIPVDVQADGIDLMSFSAHKIYGPKGVGALYVRRKDPRVRIAAQIDGGGHEKGMRSGTLNVPGIVGLGKACAICKEEMFVEKERLEALRDNLEAQLNLLGEVVVNGNLRNRLPHVSSVSFKQVKGAGLIAGFNRDIAVSTGSACSSENPAPSHVLKAMGLSDEMAYSTIRFGLGRFTTEEEIDYAIKLIRRDVEEMRQLSEPSNKFVI